MPRSVDTRSTTRFFVLTFAWTWGFQVPALLAKVGALPGPFEKYMGLTGLGLFGPFVAALIAAADEARSLGRTRGEGIRALLRPLTSFRVGWLWYVVALLLPGALLTIGMALLSLARLGMGSPNALPWFYPPREPARIVALFLIPVLEEVGWRGFALPRLMHRFGPVRGTTALGVLWATWHIPMFLMVGLPAGTIAITFVMLIGGAFFFTWLYARTGGSLLLAVLAHVGVHANNSHIPLPGNTTPLVVHTVAYVLLAFALVGFDRTVWQGPRDC